MKNIEILRTIPLRGPNIWTYRAALEAWVDIGDLEDCPSNTLPGFYERLASWLPSLIEHKCSVGERGGFLQRVKEGTWPAHILEHVTLELQNLAGMQSGFGKARQTSRRGVYKVVVRARHEEVSLACLHAARDLLMAAIEDRPFDIAATVTGLRELVDALCLGPSTKAIVDAATERNIPSIRLTDGNLVQLGYSAASRRIWTAETDRTSAIAEGIASDKDLTKSLLASCGVPVPEGRIVDSEEDAWEAAEEIGVPVVVKPSDGNHGRGVSTELMTRDEVMAAFRLARDEGSQVIVERFVRGNEHRLLVIAGRVVAAARGETAWVVGDGHSNVVELIDAQLNTDPRRGLTEDDPLNLIRLDDDPAVRLEIERQGYEPTSIPAAGKQVLIQRNGNVAFDVTPQVHPRAAAMAALAARVVGLDIAGVDLVVEDIGRPLEEQGGAIVEVNAGPSLIMHLRPTEGKASNVGPAIVDSMFAADAQGRIPLVGVTGSRGTSDVARLLAHLLALDGRCVGLACDDGLYVGRRLVEKGHAATWAAGHKLLLNPAVEAAVFENSARMILGEGLAYDRCQVGVVTDIDPAALLPDFFVETPEQLVTVLRTQVDVVLAEGVAVLNAADPRVAPLAEFCDGEVILFAADPDLAPIAAHVAQGKRALFIRAGRIVASAAGKETVLANPASIALDDTSTLAAVGAAWALGIAADLIGAGVDTFASSWVAITPESQAGR